MKWLSSPLVVLLIFRGLVRGQAIDPDIIDISKATGWANTRACLQACFITVYPSNAYGTYAGCQTNACWCRPDNLHTGGQYAYNCVLKGCSDLNDAAQARDLIWSYCIAKGYTAIATPVVTGTAGGGATETVTMWATTTVRVPSSSRTVGIDVILAISSFVFFMSLWFSYLDVV